MADPVRNTVEPPRAFMERFRERLGINGPPFSGLSPFGVRGWVVTAVIMALLLAPMLSFPLGHDNASFFVGAQKLMRGSVLYRDLVGLRPLLTYWVYCLSFILFGEHDISIRLLDFLWQGGTALLIIALIRRASRNDLWAAIAGCLYVTVYVSLSPGDTAHSESFAGLFGVGIIYLLLFRRTAPGMLAVGLLCGLLYLLKPSFVILAPVSLVAVFIIPVGKSAPRAIQSLWIVTGLLLVGALFALYILLTGSYHDYVLGEQFTRGYIAIEYRSPGYLLRYVTRATAEYFGEHYSVSLLILTAIGVAASWKLPRDLFPVGDEDPGSVSGLLRLSAMFFLVLVFSVIVEAKCPSYQFSRIYPYGVMLASCGAVTVLHRLGRPDNAADRVYRLKMGLVLVVCLLFFSPMTRYVWHSGAGLTTLLRGQVALDSYYDQSVVGYYRADMRTVGDYVKNHRRPRDGFFVASLYGGLVCRFADMVPEYKIFHSAFLIAPFVPQEWRDSTRAYLLHSQPRFIVVQLQDSIASTTSVTTTSIQMLRGLPGIDSLLNTQYNRAVHTEGFDLFERREAR